MYKEEQLHQKRNHYIYKIKIKEQDDTVIKKKKMNSHV